MPFVGVQSGATRGSIGDEIELRALGRSLWRRRRQILGPTILVALLAFVVVQTLTPRYRSEARILIEGRDNIFLKPEADKTPDRNVIDQEEIASQVQVILSRDLARHVIRQLKLTERPELDPVLNGISIPRALLGLFGLARDPMRMTPEERVLEAYYARLTVASVDRSRVISISFESSDPEFAALVANGVADGYLELQQAAKQGQARSAGHWLSGEIENMRKKVADAEAKVEQFRSRSDLFVGANSTSLASQQLADLNPQLAAARGQKADAEAKARLIRDMLQAGKPLESSEILNSELIRRLTEQRATLHAQIAEQSATLLEFHPRMKELRAQIDGLDRQIRSEAEKIVRSLESNARIADERLKTLAASLEQLKRQAASSNEQDVELRALEREAKAQRDLLESYLAKYREATARDSLDAAPADARIISRAAVSNAPAFPKKMPIVLVAALATFVLCIGFVATSELLGGASYSAAFPAPQTPGSSMLGALRGVASRFKGGETPKLASRVAPPPLQGLPASSVEDIARSMRHAGAAGGRVTLMGTARNVGTTYAAIMLGRSLAKESRAVLVDLAVGSPNVSIISNDPSAPGLADLVRGQASFGQIVTRDRFSRLHLVAVGQIGSDGAAILASHRLVATIDALSRAYDHVIIDAGALPEIAVERFARLAPRAVLVAADVQDPAIAAARERLAAAGFTGVTLLLGRPREAVAA